MDKNNNTYSDVFASIHNSPLNAPQLVPKLKVEAILLAEFDIDVGSSLSACYPPEYLQTIKNNNKISEQYLAELMLPDGAHLRDEDWTFFYLNQKSQLEQKEDQFTFDEVLQVELIKVSDGDGVHVTSAFGGIVLERDRVVIKKQEGSFTEEMIFEDDFEFSKSEDGYSVVERKPNTVTFKFVNETDEKKWFSYQHYYGSSFKDRTKSLNRKPERLQLLYCINLVRTKHISGVKRGARVKAMAICTCHQFLQVFKPLLILTLEKYFLEPSTSLLESLYTCLNKVDISSMPTLSLTEKLVLRGGNFGVLYNEEEERKDIRSKSINKLKTAVDLKGEMKVTFDGCRNYWEARADFEKICVPLKIPLDYLPEEIGDFSLSALINTFHNPQLKLGEPSGVMVIVHSVISEKRVLFLGPQQSASEVSKMVLAASSICAPILKGHADRTIPYTNLMNVDNMIDLKGYIGGVINPAFQLHDTWWDVLCDISTGKVLLSPKLNSTSPYGWYESEEGDKEKDLVLKDCEFMNEVYYMIQNRFNDIQIRQKFSKYVKRFVEIAAVFEWENLLKSKMSMNFNEDSERSFRTSRAIKIPKSRSKSVVDLNSDNSDFDKKKDDFVKRIALPYGPRAVFAGENEKRKELQNYSKRIKQWKETTSYQIYVSEWKNKVNKRITMSKYASIEDRKEDLNNSDSFLDERETSVLINKLKIFKSMDTKDVSLIYENLIALTNSEDKILSNLPSNDGGIYPVLLGLYHPDITIKKLASTFIMKFAESRIGNQAISKLNPFLNLALQRITADKDMNFNAGPHFVNKKYVSVGPRYFDDNNPYEHIVDSTTSLASAWSLPSYLSYKNLAYQSVRSLDRSIGSQDLASFRQVYKSYGVLHSPQASAKQGISKEIGGGKFVSSTPSLTSPTAFQKMPLNVSAMVLSNTNIKPHPPSSPPPKQVSRRGSARYSQSHNETATTTLTTETLEVSSESESPVFERKSTKNPQAPASPPSKLRSRANSISQSIAAVTTTLQSSMSQSLHNLTNGLASIGRSKSQQSLKEVMASERSKNSVQFISNNLDGGATFFTPYVWPKDELKDEKKDDKHYGYTYSKLKGIGMRARMSLIGKSARDSPDNEEVQATAVMSEAETTNSSNNKLQQGQKRSALDIFTRR